MSLDSLAYQSTTDDKDPKMKDIKFIEANMMDNIQYYTYMLTGRCLLNPLFYPVSLIRTRLQIQKSHDLYKGLSDAFVKILYREGVRNGLYRGFVFNNFNLITTFSYVYVLDYVQERLKQYPGGTSLHYGIAGACASLTSQVLVVPHDIVVQRLMLINKQASDTKQINQKRVSTWSVIKQHHKEYGVRGFHKGLSVSAVFYSLNSAFWWPTYYISYNNLMDWLPDHVPSYFIKAFMAAPISSLILSLLTNPLDIVRVRRQKFQQPYLTVVSDLWKEEHMKLFKKGLTARIAYSMPMSVVSVTLYELSRSLSILEIYEDRLR